MNSEDHVWGFEEPEKVREEAKNWNNHIYSALEHELKEFENAREKLGTKNLYETIRYFEDGGILEEFNYGIRLFSLRSALADLDEMVLYNTDLVSIDSTKYGYEFGTKVSKEMLQKICENPKYFAVLEILYK